MVVPPVKTYKKTMKHYNRMTNNECISYLLMKNLQNFNVPTATRHLTNKIHHHGLAQSYLLTNKLAIDSRNRRSPMAPMTITAMG